MDTYKKKYKEIVGKIRKAYLYAQTDSTKAVLEDIFPKLAESEGEKVREELIKHLKEGAEGYEPAGDSSDYQRWLAWLEKQNGNIGGISANWSEEDSQYVEDTLALIGFGLSTHTIGQVQEWLHSLQDRVQPQPKQEWNEDDEEALEMAIIALEDMYDDDTPSTTYGGHYMPFDKAANRLKSLRPHNRWKPSELQLECLSDAIEYYNSLGYPATKLKELYEQLKKL